MPPLMNKNLQCHPQEVDFRDSLFSPLRLIVGGLSMMGRLNGFVWPILLWMTCLALAIGRDGDQSCGFPVGDAEILAIKYQYHISSNLY